MHQQVSEGPRGRPFSLYMSACCALPLGMHRVWPLGLHFILCVLPLGIHHGCFATWHTPVMWSTTWYPRCFVTWHTLELLCFTTWYARLLCHLACTSLLCFATWHTRSVCHLAFIWTAMFANLVSFWYPFGIHASILRLGTCLVLSLHYSNIFITLSSTSL